MPLNSANAAICGRSVMAAFVRIFAQKVTAHEVPQDGLVYAQHGHELMR